MSPVELVTNVSVCLCVLLAVGLQMGSGRVRRHFNQQLALTSHPSHQKQSRFDKVLMIVINRPAIAAFSKHPTDDPLRHSPTVKSNQHR